MNREWVISTPEQAQRLAAFLSRLDVEKPIEVKIGWHKGRRSTPQNARYWKILELAADVIGCSSAELHEEMLCEFFGSQEIRMPTGVIRRVPNKRSSTRDKGEFSKFMEFTEIFLGERLGVWINE